MGKLDELAARCGATDTKYESFVDSPRTITAITTEVDDDGNRFFRLEWVDANGVPGRHTTSRYRSKWFDPDDCDDIIAVGNVVVGGYEGKTYGLFLA